MANLDEISAAIGELRADSKVHTANHQQVLRRLDSIGEQLAPVAALAHEVSRSRDADHEMYVRVSAVETELKVLKAERAMLAKMGHVITGIVSSALTFTMTAVAKAKGWI